MPKLSFSKDDVLSNNYTRLEKVEFVGAGEQLQNRAQLLLPQYTDAQRDALTPVAGEPIYNLTTNKINYYNGTAWRAVDDSAV